MTPDRATRLERAADFLVGLVSPRQALLRRHFRAYDRNPDYKSLVTAGLHARGYRAAQTASGQTPFTGGTRSADAEILHDLPALRNRSRELNQDDPLGSGLTKTFKNNVIGTGLYPQAAPKTADGEVDPVKKQAIENVWWRLCDKLYPQERLSHAAAQQLRFGKMLEDGEVFRKSNKRTPAEPLWYEIIEADRVFSPNGLSLKEAKVQAGHTLRDGIERDAAGIPVACWVAKAHPGDTNVNGLARSELVRVEFPVIAQIGVKSRPGQSRCVPMFHAILQDIRDLDLLLLATLKRCQIAACVSLFIKSDKAVTDLFEVTAETYGYKLEQALEPGLIMKLYPGEDVTTLIPNCPVPELGPYVVMLCRRIGAALGVSWQVVLRDFSESTYSSARTDKLDAYQTWDVLQWIFVEMDAVPEWREAMTDAVLRGEPELVAAGVTIEDVQEVEWIPNGRPWIDPLKEAQANEVALRMGVTSRTEICAKLGKEYRKVREQALQEERWEADRRKALGLPEAPVAAKPGEAKPGQAKAADDTDTDNQDDEPPPRKRGLLGLLTPTGRMS